MERMSLQDFRNLVTQEKVKGSIKGAVMVIGGIAYKAEQYESYLFHSWLTEKGIFSQHNPNEGKRSPQEGALLKSIGLLPGASDHLIFDSPPAYPHIKGVAVELKTKEGRTRANQEEYLANLRIRGWVGAVCRTAQEAIDYMISLGF